MKPTGMTQLNKIEVLCLSFPEELKNFGEVQEDEQKTLKFVPTKGVELVKLTHPRYRQHWFFMILTDDRNVFHFFLLDRSVCKMAELHGESPQTFQWMCAKHLEWRDYMENKEFDSV